MRCQGQAFPHLICIAPHPLCSHLSTTLSPLVRVLFILNSALPCTTLTLSPRVLGVGGKWGILLLARGHGGFYKSLSHLGDLGVETVKGPLL